MEGLVKLSTDKGILERIADMETWQVKAAHLYSNPRRIIERLQSCDIQSYIWNGR